MYREGSKEYVIMDSGETIPVKDLPKYFEETTFNKPSKKIVNELNNNELSDDFNKVSGLEVDQSHLSRKNEELAETSLRNYHNVGNQKGPPPIEEGLEFGPPGSGLTQSNLSLPTTNSTNSPKNNKKPNNLPENKMKENPVLLLLQKMKKNNIEIDLNIELNLPSKELYLMLINSFEDGEETLINFLFSDENMPLFKFSLMNSLRKKFGIDLLSKEYYQENIKKNTNKDKEEIIKKTKEEKPVPKENVPIIEPSMEEIKKMEEESAVKPTNQNLSNKHEIINSNSNDNLDQLKDLNSYFNKDFFKGKNISEIQNAVNKEFDNLSEEQQKKLNHYLGKSMEMPEQ